MAASEEYMLAMKLLASRMEDKPDIEFLLNKLNIKSAEDALYVVRDLYPDKLIQPKTQYVLEEIFSQKVEKNISQPDAFSKDLQNRISKGKGWDR